jgi:hypothetical protein
MKAIYIPSGTKNLKQVFPALDFKAMTEYFIEVRSNSNETIITTNTYVIKQFCDDAVRVHFLNAIGAIDALNFDTVQIIQETESDLRENSPSNPLQKHKHGLNRFNARGNDKFIVSTTDYKEADQEWIAELFQSPMAWMEWKGTQGQTDSYIPIVIENKSHEKRKIDERYLYVVEIQFRLSHPKFIIR